jgi:hypothetical protein
MVIGLTTPLGKNNFITKCYKRPLTWIASLVFLVGKPEGKRPLGKPRRRWKDNIRVDLREIGWGSMYWIDLAQDRDQWRALLNTVMNLLAP